MKNWQLYAIAAVAVLAGVMIDAKLGLSTSVAQALAKAA